MKTSYPFILVIFVLAGPLCSQEVNHLSCAAAEDNNPLYDANIEDPKTIEWVGDKKHILGNYDFQGYTLIIKGIELELDGNCILDGVDTTSTLIIEDCVFIDNGYSIEFRNIGKCGNSLSGAVIPDCAGIDNLGNANITSCKITLRGRAVIRICDDQHVHDLHESHPWITGNEFYKTENYDVLDIRGANATIKENKFFFRNMTGRANQTIQMGYRWDNSTNSTGWYPLSGYTVIEDNYSMGAFEIITDDAYGPAYEAMEQHTLKIDILTNTFEPTYGGSGGGPTEIPVFADIKVLNNTFTGRPITLYTYEETDSDEWIETHESFIISKNIFKKGIGGWGGDYAVKYGYSTETWVNAEYNNWGHISGPKNNNNRDGDINKGGKGMEVGDWIDYKPFDGTQPEFEIDLVLKVGAKDEAGEPIEAPFVKNQIIEFTPEVEYTLNNGEGKIELSVVTNNWDPVVSNLPFIIAKEGENQDEFEALTLEIPENINKLIFQAVFHPKTGTFSYSNTVDFNVQLPNAKLITKVSGIEPEGYEIIRNGGFHLILLNVKYQSDDPGTFNFSAVERYAWPPRIIRSDLFSHSQSFEATSGSEWLEFEIPVSIQLPFRDINEPISQVYIETILETDQITIKDDLTEAISEIPDKIEIGKFMIIDQITNDYRGINYFRAGYIAEFGIEMKTQILSENTDNWMLRPRINVIDKYGSLINTWWLYKDEDGPVLTFELKEQQVSGLATGKNIIPDNAVNVEIVLELINEEEIVLKDYKLHIPVRAPSRTVSLSAPQGDISLDFAPVDLKLNIDGNTRESDVTAFEYEHPHEAGIPESFKSAYSVSGFMNRFWETLTDIEEFDKARVEITINPYSDFPEDFVYNGDSLAIAVWDTVLKEYVFLPTEFNNFTLSADIGNLCTTYLVAIFEETSSINEIAMPHSERSFELLGNFPNPVEDHTRILFNLNESAEVACNIYNITGKKIWSSYNKWYSTGSQGILFKRKNFPAGIYIYQLKSGNSYITGRMILK